MEAIDPELHDTLIDVEPFTGAMMNAHQRLQVHPCIIEYNTRYLCDCVIDVFVRYNSFDTFSLIVLTGCILSLAQISIGVTPYDYITQTQGINATGLYVPLIWADQRVSISEELANEWKAQV